MTTVHDLTIDVTDILVGDVLVLGQVVMEDVTADGQVTIIERVELGPALGAELSTTEDERVEHNQTEDQSLELIVFVILSLLVEILVKLAHCATQVGL